MKRDRCSNNVFNAIFRSQELKLIKIFIFWQVGSFERDHKIVVVFDGIRDPLEGQILMRIKVGNAIKANSVRGRGGHRRNIKVVREFANDVRIIGVPVSYLQEYNLIKNSCHEEKCIIFTLHKQSRKK